MSARATAPAVCPGRTGLSTALGQVGGAALLEFLPAAAGAGIVATGAQGYRRVEKVPVAAVLDEGRALAVAVLAVAVVPAGSEGDEGMLGLRADQFAVFHLQPEPGAAQAPGTDAVTIKAGLLRRQGGGYQ